MSTESTWSLSNDFFRLSLTCFLLVVEVEFMSAFLALESLQAVLKLSDGSGSDQS